MHCVKSDETIKIYDGFLYKDSIKDIFGRKYDAADMAWTVPITKENAALLSTLGAELDDELKTFLHQDSNMKQDEQPICEMPVSMKPYQHQIKGFNRCMENDGYGLLFDVGLGKSLAAIAVAGARYKRGEVKRLLIVCPLAVQSVWERECKNLTIENKVILLEGSMIKRREALKFFPKDGLQIAVINFEGARIMVQDLLRWHPDMMIVDESHRIKNPQSAQAKAVNKIAKEINYWIILTATPVGNSIADVYSQWKVIDDKLFGTSYYAFRARYLTLGGYGNHQIIGYKNLSELLSKAYSKALRVTKEEALDLPEQIFENRICRLEPKALAIYNELKENCVSELQNGEITATNILTKLLRLQQCADGFLKPDGGEYYQQVSTAKIDLLWDTLEDIIEAGEKAVIFCRFTEEWNAIVKMLEHRKISYAAMNGGVKSSERGGIIEQFQTDATVKVMVCQISVGGVGITLTAASVAIFYSVTFSLIDYLQAVGRIHRINQKRRCLYINLIAKNTVDEHIFAALQQKKNLSDNVCDNWRKMIDVKK